ncbi:MAG: hypothetical protein ACYCPT_03290 [Acidimicrobiales bacterium]
MSTLRSDDWSVRPSFVPNGPTSPVALLCDDAGLTQLAGIPPVAWQTPWSELHALELVRTSHQMALFATVDNVRYCWRQRGLKDFEALRVVVIEHGGLVTRRRRRMGVVVVVVLVALASFAGGLGAWLNRDSASRRELADARAVNLTLRDLPGGWYASSNTVLSYIVSPARDVFTPTSTTPPAKDSAFERAATLFQSCLGVSNQKDRMYGLAGQQPSYQVQSKVFTTNSLGGVEVASTTQYYRTRTMVERDTKEMRKKNFGVCFVASNASIILSGLGEATGAASPSFATNWRPATFVKGFTRAGVIPLSVPGVASNLQLVTAIVTSGHYEVTLSALVGSFAKARPLLSTLVTTLLSRVSTSTSRAA